MLKLKFMKHPVYQKVDIGVGEFEGRTVTTRWHLNYGPQGFVYVRFAGLYEDHPTVRFLGESKVVHEKRVRRKRADGSIANGTLEVRKVETDIGIPMFDFGMLYDDIKDRPGHKGEWSSNAQAVKNHLGLELVGIECSGVKHVELKDAEKIAADLGLELKQMYGGDISTLPFFKHPTRTRNG